MQGVPVEKSALITGEFAWNTCIARKSAQYGLVFSRRGGAAAKPATGASEQSERVKRLTVRELRNTGKLLPAPRHTLVTLRTIHLAQKL